MQNNKTTLVKDLIEYAYYQTIGIFSGIITIAIITYLLPYESLALAPSFYFVFACTFMLGGLGSKMYKFHNHKIKALLKNRFTIFSLGMLVFFTTAYYATVKIGLLPQVGALIATIIMMISLPKLAKYFI